MQARQQPPKTPPSAGQQPAEVILESPLIQLDVFVTDKKGLPVTNLRREDFEVLENGISQVVNYFSVESFDASYEAPPTAYKTPPTAGERAPEQSIGAAAAERNILVFVDDLHLTPQNLPNVKKMLLDFVSFEVRDDDQVAFVTPGGSLGFLQQLTDDRAVMRLAVDRLISRSTPVSSPLDRPYLTAYEADAILRGDTRLLQAAIAEVLATTPITPEQAAALVNAQARHIVAQVEQQSLTTVNTLANAIRSLQRQRGIKLVILISDGFFLSDSSDQARTRLRSVIDAATRASVVVYTIDSRGLETDLPDAASGSNDATMQMSNLRLSSRAAERMSLQGTLVSIAHETGGTAFMNNNDLKMGIQSVLAKNNFFYSLGYQPTNVKKRKDEFRRIEVRVKGRTDVRIRFQKGYTVAKDDKTDKKKNQVDSQQQIRQALAAITPYTDIGLSVRASFINIAQPGSLIVAVFRIDAHTLQFREVNGRYQAACDLFGFFYNTSGQVVHSVSKTLTLNLLPRTHEAVLRQGVQYVEHFQPTPGLFHLRAAAREPATGKLGSASQWVEVPDLAKHQLALSDIFFVTGADNANAGEALENTPPPVIDPTLIVPTARIFQEGSWLDFGFFVYNAARQGQTEPDVVVQVQIIRNNVPIFTSPLRLVSHENMSDPQRIFYGSRLSLKGLSPGKYYLQVIVIDRASRERAFERLDFTMV